MTKDDAALEVPLRQHAFNLAMAAKALRYVPRIPKVMLDDAFPGIGEIDVTLSHDMKARALSHGEAFVLSLITAHIRPRRIFEIGTASGQGTLLMARQAPDARVDTLDLGDNIPSLGRQRDEPPWVDLSSIGVAYRESPFRDSITQHLADSARFDYSPFAGTVDLVFVDGAHTYEYVRADSNAALSMVAPGGVVVWDDCNYVCPGVARALLELRHDGHEILRIYGTRFAVLRRRDS